MINTEKGQESLKDTYDRLVPGVKNFVPEENLKMYQRTSEMHCNPDMPGGSKFYNVDNILQVLEKISASALAKKIANRTDDREALQKAGATERAFLPATKDSGAPEGLPEALYYKVEGVEGELRIDQLKNILLDTKVLVVREKGTREKKDKKYVPASLTAAIGEREFPKTDFATVIIGRDPGSDKDELWTVHPGAPIRAASKDFSWSSDLAGPEDEDGEKGVVVTTAKKLLEEGMSPDDYIKITRGEFDKLLDNRRVIREV